MQRPSFAVVDVETTDGDPRLARIIELAVVVPGTEEDLQGWHGLIDPGMPLPSFVQKLTGIKGAHLRGAPRFHQAAPWILALTEGRVIVAHNARYDMTALTEEMARSGHAFQRSTLCTERLSRQLLPNLTHHNLGSLCRYFAIPFTAAHRAYPDAKATLALLERFIETHGEERVHGAIRPWPVAKRA